LPWPATFVAQWEVEFEVMLREDPDPRGFLVAWVHTEPAHGETESFKHSFRITVQKDADFLAFEVHNHNWLSGLTIDYAGSTLGQMAGGGAMQKEQLRWLPEVQPLTAGDSFTVSISGHFTNEKDW
jgi:hypothetical protein